MLLILLNFTHTHTTRHKDKKKKNHQKFHFPANLIFHFTHFVNSKEFSDGGGFTFQYVYFSTPRIFC